MIGRLRTTDRAIHWNIVGWLPGTTLVKKTDSPFQNPSTVYSFLIKSEGPSTASHSILECWLLWTSEDLERWAHLLRVYKSSGPVISRRHCFILVFSYLYWKLSIVSSTMVHWALNLYDTDNPFVDEQSKDTYSLHWDQV